MGGPALSEGIDQSGSNVGSNAPGLHIAFNVIGTAVAWSLSSCEDLDFAGGADGEVLVQGHVGLVNAVNVTLDGPSAEGFLLPASVLEDDAFSVSSALGDGDGSLSAALVGGLGRHLSLDDLTDF